MRADLADWLGYSPFGSPNPDYPTITIALRRLDVAITRTKSQLSATVSGFDGTGARGSRLFPVSSGSNGDLGRRVDIHIRLETDIWFPRALGMLEEPPDEGEPPVPEMYDNTVLAAVHTPRFNRFPVAVREAATEAGGRFLLAEIERPGLEPHGNVLAGGHSVARIERAEHIRQQGELVASSRLHGCPYGHLSTVLIPMTWAGNASDIS